MIQQVTLLLERGDLGPEASAAILQRLLPPEALYSMQLASRADPLLVPAPRLSADRISACPPGELLGRRSCWRGTIPIPCCGLFG